jgi:hypothetical protein
MLERGVFLKHIPGSGLFMVGIMAMELYCPHEAIALWLEQLARKYRHSVH